MRYLKYVKISVMLPDPPARYCPTQARSQEFVMGGLLKGSGIAPSRRRQGGLEPPALGDFSTKIAHF